jgi:hypothetical protein
MQIVWNYNKWFVRKPSPSVALAFIKTKWVNYGEIILICLTFDKCICNLPPPFFISILLKCSALSVNVGV